MGDQVVKLGGEEVIKYGIPFGRMGTPKDIFSAALFLAGPGGAFTTGSDIIVDGGVCCKPRM
jgi:NAD(P)-dependent dehydrogenase (short-subunit alcohol dehydrogenase family)